MTSQPDPRFFRRQDESPDSVFYQQPRLVVHIDDDAITAATELYRELLPPGGVILDLMSAWRSHLPTDVAYERVVGLGMNGVELADNPQLSEWLVHDLNRDPTLPFADATFDGCVVTVSIQYLTRPIEVFREVNRVLKAGAPFVVTFSNRCFPTKAVSLWLSTADHQHLQIVESYFRASGGWQEIHAEDRSPEVAGYADPLFAVWARKAAADGS